MKTQKEGDKGARGRTVKGILLAFGLTVLFVVFFGWATMRAVLLFRLLQD
jgi:hypothetical protein